MKIQLIRNATMKITMAGKTFLTDPVFSPRHGIESFAGIEKNPTVDLPIPVSEIMESIDFILISHLHQDHFDAEAKKRLPKDIPILCRNGDEDKIKGFGFSNVRPVTAAIDMDGIRIESTRGSHAGNKKWMDILGRVTGFMLTAPDEPLVYWAGDTILPDEVKELICAKKPDIVLTHSCGAQLEDSGPIVMDARQTVDVCFLAPWAKIVAVHLEALDHGTTARRDVRDLACQSGISKEQLFVPSDGQIIEF